MFDDVVRWFHLLAAAVWVGGLITLGALVMAVRRAGADRTVLRAMAQQFGRLSWTAMAVAIVTGLSLIGSRDLGNNDYAFKLLIKLTLVGVAAGLTLFHQLTAKTASPASRGTVQASILLTSLGIVAAAVAL